MLEIYGASDDLVELEGHISDEIDCYDRNVVITVGRINVDSPQASRGVYVIMRYSPSYLNNGCWTAEIAPLEENAGIPWPIKVELEPNRRYSVLVKIDCPNDVPVSWKKIPA